MSVCGGTCGSSRMYWIHAITPLHVGSGRSVSFIDLPIMREKITGWPMIPGSTVKGVWLDYARRRRADDLFVGAAFGRAAENQDNDNAGSLAITDARIVSLSVRSLYGTFAYVTSPLVVTRLVRDMEATGMARIPAVPKLDGGDGILVTSNSVLALNDQVFFQDLDFKSVTSDDADEWAEFLAGALFETAEYVEILKRRLALVPDHVFNYLSTHGTEVSARVRIRDETKTVERGALWYEESLPAESVLAGAVWCERTFGSKLSPDQVLDEFCKWPMSCQIGGKATTGKGQVRCLFTGGD